MEHATNVPAFINDYQVLEKIGTGSQGMVYRAFCKREKVEVAIKVLKGQSLGKHRQLIGDNAYRVKNEIAVLKMARHKNLTSLIEVIDDIENDMLYLVMEYVDGIVLFSETYMENKSKLIYKEQEANHIFKQVLGTISFLHDNNILHRDIKPQNILLTEDNTVKLCDFGVSCFSSASKADKVLGVDDIVDGDVGTYLFLPPEAFLNSGAGYNGRPADLWALGVCLFLMLTGNLPFSDVDQIKRTKLEKDKFKYLSAAAIDLLKSMLDQDIDKRLSIREIYRHPWVNEDLLIVEKIKPTENQILHAVSRVKRSVWKYMQSEDKKREIKIEQLTRIVDDTLGPNIENVESDLKELRQTLGIGDSSNKEAGWKEEDATNLLPPDFYQETIDNEGLEKILESTFILTLSEVETSLAKQNKDVLEIYQTLLRLLNNSFPKIFSVLGNSETCSAQRYELLGDNFKAALIFDKIADNMSNDTSNRKLMQKLGNEISNHKNMYNKSRKAAWILGPEVGLSPSENIVISIVIIGGGYGGISCAKKLESLLYHDIEEVDLSFNFSFEAAQTSKRKRILINNRFKFKLTIIEPKDYFHHKAGSVRSVAAGNGFSHRSLIPLNFVLSYGEFLKAYVLRVDRMKQEILLQGVEEQDAIKISYDYLVCASGSKNLSCISPNTNSKEEAQQHYHQLFSKIEQTSHIVVVGSGPVALELCGEIKHFHEDKSVTLAAPEDKIFENYEDFPNELSLVTLRHLRAAGVLVTDSTINFDIIKKGVCSKGCVTFEKPQRLALTKGGSIWCEMLILCSGTKLSNFMYSSAWKNLSGKIKVDKYLRVQNESAVFAVGDICDAESLKLASNATAQGSIAAQNIVSTICQEKLISYKKKPFVFNLAIGPNRGVSLNSGRVSANKGSHLKSKNLFVEKYWKFLKASNRLQPELDLSSLSALKQRVTYLNNKVEISQNEVNKMKDSVEKAKDINMLPYETENEILKTINDLICLYNGRVEDTDAQLFLVNDCSCR